MRARERSYTVCPGWMGGCERKNRIGEASGGPSSSTFSARGGLLWWRVREAVTSGRSPLCHAYMNVVLDTTLYRISLRAYMYAYTATTTISGTPRASTTFAKCLSPPFVIANRIVTKPDSIFYGAL